MSTAVDVEPRAKYNADQIKEMVAKGQAMPNGSYPIADKVDLQNAIHAVGRGGASHNAIRKHIMKRARALGLSDMIPDNWNADGSLQASAEFGELYERAVPFMLTRDNGPGDGFTLEGYAAVFNSPTQISDRDGTYEETIAPGAFKRTISGGNPVLQFDHGQHPVLGSLPIGTIRSLREDSHGLFVSARLFDNWMTEPLRQAITADPPAVDGMSFRFQVIKDAWDTSGDPQQRTIKEVKLFELGPVVFPAYRDTSVALRSLAAHVPGLKLVFEDQTPVTVRSGEDPGTPDEPVTRGDTSDGLAEPTDPAVDDDHSRDQQERREWLAAHFSPKETP